MPHENLCLMHRAACNRFGKRTSLRYKQYGLFHDISWSDYRHQADRAAAGLLQLGIESGDRIAMLSENRYEWLIADHAILSSSAVSVPLHAPLSPAQVEYQVGHSESRGIVVSNQLQADKVFEVLSRLPQLEFVLSFERLENVPDGIRYLTWSGLVHRGQQSGSSAFDEIRRRESAITGDDLATIIYTSGTTGNPKGVMLTHNNLLTNAAETGRISDLGTGDTLLSWLPYSHIYARTVDHYLTSTTGIIVALAESIETLIDDLAEIQPMWITAVPRFYEKVWTSVENYDADERRDKLHSIFGPRIQQLTSGGAPLPERICRGFFAAGLPLLEGYGLTESSPVISFNSLDNNRIGTVGKPIGDVEVKIAADGEILSRGPHIMKGYWKNPEATQQTIVDGWLHTGDVGTLDEDGYLKITDRKKDLFVTSAGKNIAPAVLEQLLTGDIYIDQAVVYGDGRQFVSALIAPNFENLEKESANFDTSFDDKLEFIQDDLIHDFFRQRIAKLMKAVSRPERVKKILILSRPFQVEDDELTATLKVRRRHIIAKYEADLAALYEN